MKKVEFGTIAFCIAGIYAVVEGLVLVRGPLQLLTIPGDFRPPIKAAVIMLFLSPLILLLLGVMLITFADKFAKKLFPNVTEEEEGIRLQAEDLQSILFSFAGVLLVGFAIAPTLDSIARLVDLHSNFYFGGENQLRRLIRDLGWTLAGGGLQLLFGLVLFFQGKVIATFWHKLRTWSTQNESNTKEAK